MYFQVSQSSPVSLSALLFHCGNCSCARASTDFCGPYTGFMVLLVGKYSVLSVQIHIAIFCGAKREILKLHYFLSSKRLTFSR